MAAVYLAERADGQFEQRVALKLIKRGMDSEEVHRRFLSERRILARLSHPHIARLFDGGMTPEGHPWFAMELDLNARSYVAPSFVAEVYAALGQADSAFIWLERGFLHRSPQMTSIADQPWALSLRGDPGLADLRRRMGLP